MEWRGCDTICVFDVAFVGESSAGVGVGAVFHVLCLVPGGDWRGVVVDVSGGEAGGGGELGVGVGVLVFVGVVWTWYVHSFFFFLFLFFSFVLFLIFNAIFFFLDRGVLTDRVGAYMMFTYMVKQRKKTLSKLEQK